MSQGRRMRVTTRGGSEARTPVGVVTRAAGGRQWFLSFLERTLTSLISARVAYNSCITNSSCATDRRREHGQLEHVPVRVGMKIWCSQQGWDRSA